MNRTLNHEAVFSDGTKFYRSPQEPDINQSVCIRLRTAHEELSEVLLITNNNQYHMNLEKTEGRFDYYQVEFNIGEQQVAYYFQIRVDDKQYYYTSQGISDSLNQENSFKVTPGFHTPDWAKGAVFYQIFVERFYNGDSSNDVLDREYIYIHEATAEVKNWMKPPEINGIREFYGGDLLGVIKKLDYLKELGVEVLYMNPLFVSPSNHKYDIQDYDYIDPHYGVIVEDGGECLKENQNENKQANKYIKRVTNLKNLKASNQLFINLVEEVHKRGMKIILDGVFNHCGSFNKWMDREEIYSREPGYLPGAYVEKDSPYHSFFQFRKDSWPNNESYDGWWGHDTLPKLNYEESDILKEYIMKIARKWVSPPFNADGWRLDVAADLGHTEEYNHRFWKEFRNNVRDANPEALILAEHYGDAQPWLTGDEWDSVMNYDAFMDPITWFLTGMEKHSDEYRDDLYNNYEFFYKNMMYYMGRFQTQSLQVAMNELSNHDHSRFLTRTNHKVGRTQTAGAKAASQGINMGIMREAVVMQMTWVGAPTVYYGDEAGLCGWTDPDNRRTYPWGNEDHDLIHMHKELIRMHKSYEALQTGSIKILCGCKGMISYARFTPEEQFIIIVNNNDGQQDITVPVWQAGVDERYPMVRMFYTNMCGFGVDTYNYTIEAGMLKVSMEAYSSLVIKNYPIELR